MSKNQFVRCNIKENLIKKTFGKVGYKILLEKLVIIKIADPVQFLPDPVLNLIHIRILTNITLIFSKVFFYKFLTI